MTKVENEIFCIDNSVLQSQKTNENSNDCTIVCEGKTFEVNRQLLAEGNLYFRTMFSSSMKESKNKAVVLYGVTANALEAILYFLQTKNLPALKSNLEYLFDLLSASHMLLMDEMFEHCCHHLKIFISRENMFDFWNIVKFYDNDTFSDILMDFFANHFASLTNEIMELINMKEMKFLFKKLYAKNISAESVLNFMFSWIKDHLVERSIYLEDLVSAINMSSLTEDKLKYYLTQEPLVNKILPVSDLMKETFSIHQLHLYVFSKESLQKYWIHHKQWSELHKMSFLRKELILFSFICKKLYILSFTKSSILQPDCLYSFNKDGSSENMCLRINSKCNNQTTVSNDNLYFLKSNYKRTIHCWENVLYVYDLSTNQLNKPLKYTSSLIVQYLVVVSNNLITFERNLEEGVKIWKRCDLTTKQWHNISAPESLKNLKGFEFSTRCLGDLFHIVWERESKYITWYENQAIPTEEIDALRAFGAITVSKYRSLFICKALYRTKYFFRYNLYSDAWEEIMTCDGPEKIHYVWEGPCCAHLRIPFIYIIGDDFVLYQYDPNKNLWNKLTKIPNKDKYEMKLKFFTLGC